MKKAALNPHLSVDCVIFGYNDHSLSVLLVDREMPPAEKANSTYKDLKLPGGLIYNDELLIDAAARILEELTTLQGVKLNQFGVLDSLDRLSNEADRKWLEQTTGLTIDRVVSIAYYGIVSMKDLPESIPSAHWVDINNLDKLPFDHEKIICEALNVLRQHFKKEGLIFDILPEKFTIHQLQSTLAVFYGEKADSRNFRKKIKKMDFIVPLEEKQQNVAHKPAQLYRYDKRRFRQFSNNRINF